MRWLNLGILLMCLLISNAAAAGRPVVLEEFTGTWCGYCYGAGGALDRIEENYKRSEVIVIAYHISDTFANTATETRRSYYDNGVYPTVWFNGLTNEVGGSTKSSGAAGIDQRYQLYVSDIAKEKTRTAGSTPFTITLTGSVGPVNPRLTATITTPTGFPRTVQARFFIAEDKIAYNATNGQTVLNGVVRASLGTKSVTLTAPGAQTVLTASLTGTVTCKSAANLYPVVIIQDDSNHEIVGAIGEFTLKNAAANWSLYQ